MVKTPSMAEEGSWFSFFVASGCFRRRKKSQGLFLATYPSPVLFRSLHCLPISPVVKAKVLSGHMPSALHLAPETIPVWSCLPLWFPTLTWLQSHRTSFSIITPSLAFLRAFAPAIHSACYSLFPGIQEVCSLMSSRSQLRWHLTRQDFSTYSMKTAPLANSTTLCPAYISSFSSIALIITWFCSHSQTIIGFCEKWFNNKSDTFSHWLHCKTAAKRKDPSTVPVRRAPLDVSFGN